MLVKAYIIHGIPEQPDGSEGSNRNIAHLYCLYLRQAFFPANISDIDGAKLELENALHFLEGHGEASTPSQHLGRPTVAHDYPAYPNLVHTIGSTIA